MDTLDETLKAHLLAWFEYLSPKDSDELKPWWNERRQADTKCWASKVVLKRDSQWQGEGEMAGKFACSKCTTAKRPCIRVMFVDGGDGQMLHELRVLPQGKENSNRYWGNAPGSTA